MAAGAKRFHDIPLARQQIVDALATELGDEGASAAVVEEFRELSRLLGAIFHYEMHAKLEDLKAAYGPLNPDREPESRSVSSESEATILSERVESTLASVLEHGNYQRLSQRELEHALAHKVLFPALVSVDFDVFDDYFVFARGESLREIAVKKWLGLRTERIAVPTYDRVCLYLRFKAEAAIDAKKRKRLACEPGMTLLKLFRNIPKADIDMLFPNTELRMRLRDKLLIGVPAVVGGVPVLLKLTPVVIALGVMLGLQAGHVNWPSLVAALSGLVGLGLFLFHQWDKFKSRKILFLRMLSENLYFLNIDNNEGVLTRLIDEAEEEEHKEALLAYHFLRREPGLDAASLDREVEAWLARRFDVHVDFEIEDALSKLARFGLARPDGSGYRVESIEGALRLLVTRWNGFFSAGRAPAEVMATG